MEYDLAKAISEGDPQSDKKRDVRNSSIFQTITMGDDAKEQLLYAVLQKYTLERESEKVKLTRTEARANAAKSILSLLREGVTK